MSEIIYLVTDIFLVIIGLVIVDGVIGGLAWSSPLSSAIVNHIFPIGLLLVLVVSFVYAVIEHLSFDIIIRPPNRFLCLFLVVPYFLCCVVTVKYLNRS